MKKLLSIFTILSVVLMVACTEDPTYVSPSVSASSVGDQEFGATGATASFTVSYDADLTATYTVTTTGGISLTSDASGDVSGTAVDVTFDAGTTAGAASITVTVTDTEGQTANATAVFNIAAEVTEVTVSSNITADATWATGKTYTLGGRIAVVSGVTLTIEPGVVVKGEAGTDVNATALLIARGATLMANGTADLPIIFTSVADEITPEMVAAGNFASPNLEPNIAGLWGGVIVLGSAKASLKNDATEGAIEGIPTSDPNGLYGGSDDASNSGSITYVSIRHGGSNIGEGNEINGLTLGAVGTGTTIMNVEVVSNADDGIEFFGGKVELSKILIWNCNDDGLDTDQDFQGKVSDFAIITPVGGSGFELDGPEGTGKVNDANGFHTFDNGILYAGADIAHLVDWDDNTNAEVKNLFIYGLDSSYLANYANTSPIASFDGDGSGPSSNWEVMWPSNSSVTVTEAFGAGAAAITTEVTTGSYGPAASDFTWTWASKSGTLTEIGL